MGMRLFLVAFIVSVGLVFVQPSNKRGNDPHEVRENFRHLFNSINKNDLSRTDTYRTALEEEAAREKEAFDTMKDTWRARRQRNADEHRDTRRRRAAFKREAGTPEAPKSSSKSPAESPGTCSTPPEPSSKSPEPPGKCSTPPEPSSKSPEPPGKCSTPSEPSEQSISSPPEQSTAASASSEPPSEGSPSSEPFDEQSNTTESTTATPSTRRSTRSYELATFIQSNVTRPASPKPTDENCVDLKSAIWSYNMKDFVKVIDTVYAKLFRHPQSNQGSLDVLNHIMNSCNTHTRKLDVIRRQDHRKDFSNGTEAAGVLDIRTIDQKGGNLVIKIKFNRDSCVALGQLLNCLDLDQFKSLYPGEKISLLAMTFNKDDEGAVVREWIALYAQDGEIVGKGEQRKAACLKTDEYKNMTYKEKPILAYFDSL